MSLLLVISPAKRLDETLPSSLSTYSMPQFVQEAEELGAVLKKKKAAELKSLLDISDDLIELNMKRYKHIDIHLSLDNAKQAILLFKGDVYQHIDVEHYVREDFSFAQQHVRILSGLYGVLRPLDLMHPYRLEMGTKLVHKKFNDLYEFWGGKITKSLNAAMKAEGIDTLVNLASIEYFSAVQKDKIKGKLVNIKFLEKKDGEYKNIGVQSKRARGMMVNYMIRHRYRFADELKSFDLEGYRFSESHSGIDEWVFVRG